MRVKRTWFAVFSCAALGAGVSLSGCGDDVGACVSDAVEYNFGLRVYCYDGWDKSDCDTNNDEEVNGASWTFYGGQDCSDRDLTTGSNPWP